MFLICYDLKAFCFYKLQLQKKITTKQKGKNETLFQGDLDCNGVRVGMGHLEIPNGSTYDGSFNKVIVKLCEEDRT